jgi:hypothetical protein
MKTKIIPLLFAVAMVLELIFPCPADCGKQSFIPVTCLPQSNIFQ